MSNEVKKRIIAALEKARRVSITTDIWSSKCSTDSFIGITTHMVNPSTHKREVYRICCRVFNSKHSGINIARMMKRLFVEFHIEKKVFRIISDNASNMIKAVRDLQAMEEGEELKAFKGESSDDDSGAEESSDCDSEPDNIEDDDEVEIVQQFTGNLEKELEEHAVAFKTEDLERLPCSAHTMQLPINKCINKKKKYFGSVIRKTRKIVKKYRKSPKAKAILRKKVKNRLAGYVKTRWWTDVQMAKTVVKAAKVPGNPLNDMMYEMKWNIELTENDVDKLESFISIMSPFQDLSDKLGGEKLSTIHLVYPSVKELIALLDEKMQNGEAKTFCQDVKVEVSSYFRFAIDADFYDFNAIYIAATYLDPFYKLALDEEMTNNAKDYVKKMIKEEQEEVTADISEGENIDAVNQLETEAPQNKPKFILPGFSRISQQIMSKSKGSGGGGNRSNQLNTIEAELIRDFELYDKKAEAAFNKAVVKAEHKLKEKFEDNTESEQGSSNDTEVEATVKPEDPLDFWLLQV